MSGHTLIIGGGASGLLAALHLLRQGPPSIRITIAERGPELGRGIAYGTPHPSHLLNMRSANMSAYADEPDHFLRWLAANGHPAEPQGFVPRHLFGEYLEDLLAPARKDGRLRWENQDCTALRELGTGFTARLGDGSAILAQTVILATGHMLPQGWEPPFTDPWLEPPPADPDAQVMMLGTGLTMVDRAMRLLAAGHRGRMVLVSRHGLLPQPHSVSNPVHYDRADLPLGAGAGYTLAWLRKQMRWHLARGGDWRDVIDGLRPFMPDWWQSTSLESRARFLRHARRYWEVHRHRVPMPVIDLLAVAAEKGQIQLLKGRLHEVAGSLATIRLLDGTLQTFDVAQISDCRGVLRDPHAHATPFLRDLLASGLARIDPLGIGLDVTADGRVKGGTAALYAIGPITRPAFWEASSVIDIRAQAARLAARILPAETKFSAQAPG